MICILCGKRALGNFWVKKDYFGKKTQEFPPQSLNLLQMHMCKLSLVFNEANLLYSNPSEIVREFRASHMPPSTTRNFILQDVLSRKPKISQAIRA